MKKITEVSLTLSEASGSSKDCCSYLKSRLDDRDLHRSGLCIIHLGTLFGRCPRLENFNGINIGRFPMPASPVRGPKDNSFSKWNGKVRPLFHNDYLRHGGRMEIKDWARKRWFSRQPSIPTQYGKARLPSYMR